MKRVFSQPIRWITIPNAEVYYLYVGSTRGAKDLVNSGEIHSTSFTAPALPGGRTHLEGTTWYALKIHPAAYWHLWSDLLIHQIHGRVLEHIKREV